MGVAVGALVIGKDGDMVGVNEGDEVAVAVGALVIG